MCVWKTQYQIQDKSNASFLYSPTSIYLQASSPSGLHQKQHTLPSSSSELKQALHQRRVKVAATPASRPFHKHARSSHSPKAACASQGHYHGAFVARRRICNSLLRRRGSARALPGVGEWVLLARHVYVLTSELEVCCISQLGVIAFLGVEIC